MEGWKSFEENVTHTHPQVERDVHKVTNAKIEGSLVAFLKIRDKNYAPMIETHEIYGGDLDFGIFSH